MCTTTAPARPRRDTTAAALAGLAGLALSLAGLVATALPAAAAQETCPETGGAWIKEDGFADGTTALTVAAPSTMVIVETCVKAADEVAYASYSPGEYQVTVTSPAATQAGVQQSISHVSYRVEMAPTTPGGCPPELSTCTPAPQTPAPQTPAPQTPAPQTPAPQAPAAPPAPTTPPASRPIVPSVPSVPEVPAPATSEASPVESPAPVAPAQPPVSALTPSAQVHGAPAPIAPSQTTALAAAGPRGLALTGADAWVVVAAVLLAGLGMGVLALRRRLAQQAQQV